MHDKKEVVKRSAYKMSKDFRKATDELFAVISHDDLAKALGCSVATIRQARLDASAKAHRNPPEGWEKVVVKLAEGKAGAMTRLATRLKSSE
jgi:hypothetical protein